MKNKRLSILLCGIIMLGMTGCVKEKEVNITMNCNGNIINNNLKVNEKLTCSLLGNEYEFTITKIENESVDIKVNSYGLIDTNSLIDKKDSFIIKSDEVLKLNTQSTDYQEIVTFQIK